MVLIGDKLFPIQKKIRGRVYTLEETGTYARIKKYASMYEKGSVWPGPDVFYLHFESKKDPTTVGGIRYALYLADKPKKKGRK